MGRRQMKRMRRLARRLIQGGGMVPAALFAVLLLAGCGAASGAQGPAAGSSGAGAAAEQAGGTSKPQAGEAAQPGTSPQAGIGAGPAGAAAGSGDTQAGGAGAASGGAAAGSGDTQADGAGAASGAAAAGSGDTQHGGNGSASGGAGSRGAGSASDAGSAGAAGSGAASGGTGASGGQQPAKSPGAGSGDASQPAASPQHERQVTVAITGDAEHGVILKATAFTHADGMTVLDLLKQAAKDNNIQLEYKGRGKLAYVEGIDDLYEFDKGAKSGWLYRVNGKSAGKGAGDYELQPGDKVEWFYTENMGKDVGVRE